MSNVKRPILLVEDDENDIFFLQEAFHRAELFNPVNIVRDGQAVIDYLSGDGPFADRNKYPIPYLVLLDLKLPKKMGMEVLRWIRSRPEFATLIVIVLTSSSNTTDITEALLLGARSYLVKPVGSSERVELVKVLMNYWLNWNRQTS